MSREPAERSFWFRHSVWPDVAIGCVLLTISLAYFSLTLTHSFDLRDEGFVLFESSRSAAGEVPHRDFDTVYGPGVFLLNGLVLASFDGNILPIRILLAFVKAGAVVLTFLMTRLLATRSFAVLGALLSVAYWGRPSWNLNTAYAALYTIPLCMLSVYLLIRALLHDSARGYAAAGLIAGAAILFKQSLGIFNAYGMILAVCAVSALDGEPAKQRRFETPAALSLWVVAAIALVIPFSSILSLSDYALHFLPVHLMMALVAAAVLFRGGLGLPLSHLAKRLCLLALGLAVMPGLTALVYAYWGSLRDLIFNMFVFSRTLPNYYVAVPIPPFSLALFMLGAIASISSGLLLVRGRRRPGVILVTSGIGLMLFARYVVPVGELQTVYGSDFPVEPIIGRDLYALTTLFKVERLLAGVQAPAIAVAALAFYSSSFFRPHAATRSRALCVVIPLVLFQTLMCFQVFPRATYNVWLVQGALMPLLTLVLFRWYRLGVPAAANVRRKATAAAAVVLLPLWMVAPVVSDVVSMSDAGRRWQPLELPAAGGIELDEFQFRFGHIGELESLIAFLRAGTPGDSPLFLLTNEAMIQFSSRRAPLFPDRAFHLYLLGWGMLPEEQRRELDVDAMLRRLAATPEAIVVFRPDPSSARLLEGLPGLLDFLTNRYEVFEQIGEYRLLRQKQR